MAGKKSRSFSQIATYIRRRAEITITRLEGIIANARNPIVAQGARKTIDRIRQTKEQTYLRDSNGKRISQPTREISRATQQLAAEVDRAKYTSRAGQRSLRMTEKQLNMGSVGNPASIYTKEDVKIFYRATQRLWEGASISERNTRILERSGYERLSDLVADVLAANEVARMKARNYTEVTPEQREFMDNEQDVKEAQQSPDAYLQYVIQMEDTSGLSDVLSE